MTAPHYTNSQNSIISFEYSWFLGKNISNFVSPDLKIHNLYCHTVRTYPREFAWVQWYKALDRNNHVYRPVRQIIKSNHTFCSVFNLSFIFFRITYMTKITIRVNGIYFSVTQRNEVFLKSNPIRPILSKNYLQQLKRLGKHDLIRYTLWF